ncbi:FAD-dependent oxidoreductase [Nocardia sp. NPDC057353]|uniref:FAD-dependent oxidoreductase n=1 Tax=Nocardia sp. NPDC057353 TaxID=3346104 RepID=UPI00362FB804
MAYVITQRCCNDASCVSECPVDCIRPRPEDPEFATAEMLYIDPDTCIDCGACFEACPVGAVYAEEDLPPALARYPEINAGYFQRHPLETDLAPAAAPRRLPRDREPLRVAIVGTGPAACYAAEQLLGTGRVEVEMFDRLPTPWGLVRYGVAPDHSETRGVADMFTAAFKRDALRMHLNTEIGTHLTHDDLLAHCHAVLYAVGASADRRLGIPGEELPGSHAGTDFVAWYNGHPDHAGHTFDLSGEHAVVVGNGNVALDIARVLTADPEYLARTDIADHALEALRHSNIREVTVLARRGPLEAAYTAAEFLALRHLPGVDVILDPTDLADLTADGHAPEWKLRLAREYAERPRTEGNRRIRFAFHAAPVELGGADRVQTLTTARTEQVDGRTSITDQRTTLEASLVLRAIGYRGRPVPGLPFDDAAGIVPNDGGRVAPGVYVSGWIKRGPRGVIGSNRADAAETVGALLDDFIAGSLTTPAADRDALAELVRQRNPDVVDRAGWQTLDQAERTRGAAQGRPRVKIASVEQLLATARGR